jgi:hypothetical protein
MVNNLTIYQEGKRQLSPISFLNDVKNQVKIRDIDTESIEFRNQLGFFFTKTNNFLGIKESILDVNKTDIKELILIRFKGLSLNELDYAFKMERYGEFGKRVEHFQLFNAEYCAKVIDRYLSWKEFKRKNNINTVNVIKEISEQEKTNKENDIIIRYLETYDKERFIYEDYFYVYDILDKRGFMSKDRKYKESVYKDAIYLLKQEQNDRKASSLEERRSIKSTLKIINSGVGGGIKKKCKILALEDYFRDLFKNDQKVIEFKNKFKK